MIHEYKERLVTMCSLVEDLFTTYSLEGRNRSEMISKRYAIQGRLQDEVEQVRRLVGEPSDIEQQLPLFEVEKCA